MREFETTLSGDFLRGLRRFTSVDGLKGLWGLEPAQGGVQPFGGIPELIPSDADIRVRLLGEDLRVDIIDGNYNLSYPGGTLSLGPLSWIRATSYAQRFFLIGEDFLGNRFSWWNTSGGIVSGPTEEVPSIGSFALFCRGQLLMIHEKRVSWSSIGRLDFRPEEDLTAGWLNVDFQPLWMGLLGNNILLLHSKGGGLLVPTPKGWAFQELPLKGLASVGAVSGSESSGYKYLSPDGHLQEVLPSGQIQELGYAEFFPSPEDWEGFFWEPRKMFIFTRGETTLIHNGLGLFESSQRVDSAWGLSVSGESLGWPSWGLSTGELFRDTSYLKSLESVEVQAFGGGDVVLTVAGGPVKYLRGERISFPRYTGKTLQLRVSGSAKPEAFTGITLKMKFPDKRFTRGVSGAFTT